MKWMLAFLLCHRILIAEDAEFEKLMGKNSNEWIYVSKKEDVFALEKFKEIYERNKFFQFEESQFYRIPKLIHLIWLSPHIPPMENMTSWIEKHPDWQIKLWTEKTLQIDNSSVTIQNPDNFPFLFSRKAYEEAKNIEEKEDILRYEILYQEGGLAVSLGVRCLQSFDSLNKGYDFFCGLKQPHPPINGRNISSVKEVIGARPFHPVIGKMIKSPATGFIDVLLDHLGEDGNQDIVFPASYFSCHGGFVDCGMKSFQQQTVSVDLKNKVVLSGWLKKGALSLNLVALAGAWIYFSRRKRKREG